MQYPALLEAQFLKRLNRFAALVLLDGKEVMVHVANSGRMRELFQPGTSCYLSHQPGECRKTAYDLVLVAIERNQPSAIGEEKPSYRSKPISPIISSLSNVGLGRALVSADSRVPNTIIWEAWREGILPHFDGYTDGRREVTFHDSRFDMMLRGPTGLCYMEMKSVTLVMDSIARFPDAPTERGRKHIGTLMKAVEEGHRAATIFVIQRDDATGLSPYDNNDPEFGAALREAVDAGVEAYAFICTLTRQAITIAGEVPVLL